MAYGKIKAEKLVYEDSGSDVEVAISTLGGKADVDGQTFTGNVVLPSTTTGTTQSAGDNSTKLATTAYADAATSATFTEPLTVGVDDTGHDVKFFGDTTGKYCLWDTSADKLAISGSISVTGDSTFTDHANFGSQVTFSAAGGNNLMVGEGFRFRQIVSPGNTQSILEMDYGKFEAYWQGSKKLETTTDGVTVTGELSTSGINLANTTQISESDAGSGSYNTLITNGTNGDIVIRGAELFIQDKNNTNVAWAKFKADGSVELNHVASNTASTKLETTATGVTVTGTVTDSKGDLRKIIQNTQGSAYTLVAADAGKHILASGTVTVPDSVFAAGDAVTIVNNTASDLTITKTITTMYMSTDATSANRTLATRGMATILFASGTVAYISGAGLS